jgi:phosphoserine phosphatase RsbU/P
MERELAARDERERAILDNTTAIIHVKGVDGRYQFVNRRHADLFSLDRATVIGKTVYDLHPPEMAEALARNDRHVLETRETITIQETVPHADGNHTYVSVKFPLFDGNGRVSAVAGISTDITDQLRAREADEQMRLAHVFQQKLYPETAPSVPGLDVAGWARPISQVCGDYFDYLPRGGGLAVSLGDVSGHGFGPALQMVEVRTIIRILLRASIPLQDVVEELNRALCLDLPESSFVSLFLAEIDAARGELRYVGAGHQALLFGAGGGTTTLESTGPLLGILDSAAFDCPAPISVRPGDMLVLFTDGLTEAMDLRGEQFGVRRLVETVERHRGESSRAILENLFAAVYDFARGRTLQDDMTAITVKVVG